MAVLAHSGPLQGDLDVPTTPFGAGAESDRPHSNMAQQQARGEIERPSVDRTRGGQGGSIGLVVSLALALMVAGVGLLLMGRPRAEPYVLGLLALLAMAGVFLLFALAAGILRVAGKDAANPLLKGLVDRANDAILVTNTAGRVVYANAAYLRLVDATGTHDVRPVERAFAGDAGVSEAVFRLLKAARDGRRLQEEVRVGGPAGESGRWLRMRVRPLGDTKREAKLTVWSIADVTRELERQENAFQELQHAVDYLDHAPAGFFSIEPDGRIRYLNATLAEWIGLDLAEFGMDFYPEFERVPEVIVEPDGREVDSAPVLLDAYWQTTNGAAPVGAGVGATEERS